MNEGAPRMNRSNESEKSAGQESWDEKNLRIWSESGFKQGEQVTVERSNGDRETDWRISTLIYNSKENQLIEVEKPDPEGRGMLRKTVPLDMLREWNSR